MEQVKLKAFLKEKGVSAYRVAKECEISLSDMYCAINGKKQMFPKWRKKIASYLQVEESEIFEEMGRK